LLLFFNADWALTSGGFRIVSDTFILAVVKISVKEQIELF